VKRIRQKAVKSFALRLETLEMVRTVAAKAGIAGGQSAIVEDAVSSWLNRYAENPEKWLRDRGLAVSRDATDDI
jgi:hypothetical protein